MSKQSKIAGVLADINKLYGTDTIMRASEAGALQLNRILFGIPSLDLAVGGGLPRGRLTLLRGDYSTGKSLVALFAAKAFQNHCRFCGKTIEKICRFTGEVSDGDCRCDNATPMQVVWLDIEGTFENSWAKQQGVNLDHCYVIRPEYTEQGIDVSDKVIRSKEADLIVIDSIAAMAPSMEVESSSEEWQVGVQARLINKALRKWNSGMNSCGLSDIRGNPAVILINQVRIDIKKKFGNPETSPGGKGQEFHTSIIVRMANKGQIKQVVGQDGDGKDIEEVVGRSIGFDVSKNKTYAPFKSGVFDFYFSDIPGTDIKPGYIDVATQWFALGRLHGFITKNGSWFSLLGGNDRLGHGKANAIRNLVTQYPDVCEQIWQKVCLKELKYVP
jgi:recombination protein RecA